MHCLSHLRNIVACNAIQRQGCEIILNRNKYEISNRNLFRTLTVTACVHKDKSVAKPLRSTKPKSKRDTVQYFIDIKQVKTLIFKHCLQNHNLKIFRYQNLYMNM